MLTFCCFRGEGIPQDPHLNHAVRILAGRSSILVTVGEFLANDVTARRIDTHKNGRRNTTTKNHNALKDILKLPDSTPPISCSWKQDIYQLKKIMIKKKVMQKLHIEEKPEDKLVRSVTKEGIWKEHIDQIMEKYQMQNQTKKREARKIIDKENKRQVMEEINKEAETKSKTKHWVDNIGEIKTGNRPKYINILTRKQCSAIVKARTRMLPVKENFKGSYHNTTCCWCKNTAETQRHIIDECPNTRNITGNMKYEDIFRTADTGEMEKIANTLNEMIEKLEE